jgi:tyramine---L-glutamate ligase
VQNKPIKKIFVCEFITGGGFNHSDLPIELTEQGRQMRDALLRDLSLLPYQISTTIDVRLTPPVDCDIYHAVGEDKDIWQVWEDVIRVADAVWFIAPETDGYLARMTALAMKHKNAIIGCGSASITICSSKLATCQLLKQAEVETLDTFLFSEWNKAGNKKWLAKPDDGAGCEETICFDTALGLERWLLVNNKTETHVVQPYLAGDAASISCVMYAGNAYVLSCNKQLIAIENGVLVYKGCVVNGMSMYWEAFESLANKIAQLLPNLAGYVGIDVIVSDANAKQLTVVEVNPRLTTSYVALKEATGHNPAELIIKMLTLENYTWPTMQQNIVRLEVSSQRYA